jgi:hypothetical protein
MTTSAGKDGKIINKFDSNLLTHIQYPLEIPIGISKISHAQKNLCRNLVCTTYHAQPMMEHFSCCQDTPEMHNILVH